LMEITFGRAGAAEDGHYEREEDLYFPNQHSLRVPQSVG